MSYQQASIPVPESLAELLSDALMEHGALSAAIEDALAGTENEQPIFGEPDMPQQQVWQQSLIIALFDEHADVARIIADAAAGIATQQPEYSVETLEEQDWVRLTQSQFDPIKISDRLWITPTWHDAPDAHAINLRLDPGLAFGTGSHPTTHLCLQWLDNNLRGGESVLDYGCGSGILTIAALKLGAGSATGWILTRKRLKPATTMPRKTKFRLPFICPTACRKGSLMWWLPIFWPTRCACSAICWLDAPKRAAKSCYQAF